MIVVLHTNDLRCFIFQICNLASCCLCSCGTDAGSSTENDNVLVYVWGSNSSHQLAEGTLEKILLPKLTQGFSDAQMVRLHRTERRDTSVKVTLFFIKVLFCTLTV